MSQTPLQVQLALYPMVSSESSNVSHVLFTPYPERTLCD